MNFQLTGNRKVIVKIRQFLLPENTACFDRVREIRVKKNPYSLIFYAALFSLKNWNSQIHPNKTKD